MVSETVLSKESLKAQKRHVTNHYLVFKEHLVALPYWKQGKYTT